MASVIDMIGFRSGKLLVIEEDLPRTFRGAKWKCQCDCGGTTTSNGADLRNGASKSCGRCTRRGSKMGPKDHKGKTYAEIGRGPSPLAGKSYQQQEQLL